MTIVLTLSSKGQLTLPKSVREALQLSPGSKLQGSVGVDGRLVLSHALHEPEDLFQGRPKVKRPLTVQEMERAVWRGAARGRV